MAFYFSACEKFAPHSCSNTLSWNDYIEWSKLTHLVEVVSVDFMLNKCLVEPDRENAIDWNHIVTDDLYETGFFNSLDYVVHKTKLKDVFNLLAVIINPPTDCKNILLENFQFKGYDLLDREYKNSALTNCGGFDETFQSSALNHVGLIDDFENAYDIRSRLLKNNPNEHHADTNVIAIWRHQLIGIEKPKSGN